MDGPHLNGRKHSKSEQLIVAIGLFAVSLDRFISKEKIIYISDGLG